MSARWMTRCRACGVLTHEPERLAMVRCDVENCGALVEDAYGWGPGNEIRVPPGWTRVVIDVTGGVEPGAFSSTVRREGSVRYYCPLHTEAAIAAATRAS